MLGMLMESWNGHNKDNNLIVVVLVKIKLRECTILEEEIESTSSHKTRKPYLNTLLKH